MVCKSAVLMLLALACQLAAAEQFVLRIEVSSEGDTTPPSPSVLVNGKPVDPNYDAGFGMWQVPIVGGTSFVTPFQVATHSDLVHPVRLEIPATLLTGDESIYLSPAEVATVDEPSVHALWSNNLITRRPSDMKLQFEYLQTLLYMNKKIQNAGGTDASFSSATRASASLMLSQVVANLADRTWYVADAEAQEVIDKAVTYLRTVVQSGWACRWLGQVACNSKGMTDLLATVENTSPKRGLRMMGVLLPSRSISKRYCVAAKISDLMAFWKYARMIPSDFGAFSKARVASDISACRMMYALCADIDTDARLSELEETKDLLASLTDSDASSNTRLKAVQTTLNELRQGHPAICPDQN